jgi:hypothetical protein
VYSAKRDTLKFKAKVNNDQVLDGALEPYSVLADDKFAKEFSSASLFIDNWVTKDTQVTINNYFSEDVELHKIEISKDGKTAANYIYDVLGGIAGLGYGVVDAVIYELHDIAGTGLISAAGYYAGLAAEAAGLGV